MGVGMAWRLARSLETLQGEIRTLHPGTTVWTIGDAAHAATWSDHNPNAAGVVCAIDVKGNAGLKLGAFAEHVRTRNHRAFKYVIFNRRIASRGGDWRAYHGSNPHLDHVHISVGVGSDGRSTGPYDDTSPWGLIEEDDMALPRKGDRGEEVELLQRMLNAVGHSTGPEAVRYDGSYGDAVERAVAAFRVANGIQPENAGGGRVTPWTYYMLLRRVGALDGDGDGKDGRDGKDATPEQIEAAVDTWMGEHRDELRGPPGEVPTEIAIRGLVLETQPAVGEQPG